jgi:hypothetical protein
MTTTIFALGIVGFFALVARYMRLTYLFLERLEGHHRAEWRRLGAPRFSNPYYERSDVERFRTSDRPAQLQDPELMRILRLLNRYAVVQKVIVRMSVLALLIVGALVVFASIR